MRFLNVLRQRQATYKVEEIDSLIKLRDGTDATLARAGEATLHVGKVAQVIAQCSDYAVYTDHRGNVRYVQVGAANEAPTPAWFNLMWNRVTHLQFLLNQLRETHLDVQLDMMRVMIGDAISCGLENDRAAMEAAVADLEVLLGGKVQRNARRLYVKTALRVSVITILGAMVLLMGVHWYSIGGMLTQILAWSTVAALGALGGSAGAALSILTAGDKDVPFDPMSSADYARFEARVRVLTGLGAGVVMAICVDSKIIASSLTNITPPEAGTLFFSIVAGFIERLVPNLLSSGATTVAMPDGKGEEKAKDSEAVAVPTPAAESPTTEDVGVEATDPAAEPSS